MPALLCRAACALAVFALAGAVRAAAQVADSVRAEEVEEVLLEEVEDEAVGDALAEQIEALRRAPLDLNTATAAELATVPGLSLRLAERIAAYRARVRGFRSLPELATVADLSEAQYAAVRPFLRLGPLPAPRARRASAYPASPSWSELRRDLRLDVVQRGGRRLGVSRGDTSAYAGSDLRATTRLRLRSRRRIDAALVLDTDAGERAAFAPAAGRIGSDFASAGVLARDLGRIETVVVGDFAARFGQGLVAWRAGGLGKSREATRGVARAGAGLSLHASTEETRFLRGGGLSVRLTPTVTATAYASRRRLDATPSPDSASFTTIGTSGLHRTAAELARRARLGETHGGAALRLRRGRVDVGVLATATRYDAPLAPATDAARRFAFRGDAASAVSVFGHGAIGRRGAAVVFGELARSTSGGVDGGQQHGIAATGGLSAPLGGGSEAVVAARAFGRAFTSRFGDAFAERSGTPQNEQGVYAGLRLRATRALTATAYLDAYRFPWARTTAPRPSEGLDLLAAAEYRPRRWLALVGQIRHETRDEGAVVVDALGRERATTLPETRESARLHGEYVFSRSLLLRARVEGVRFARRGEPDRYGTLVYQDLRIAPRRRPLGATVSLDLRLTLFDTDGYDARVYAYESDVRYGFSVPALSGRGTRAYVLARAARGRLSAEARYAVTRFDDVETVGSGLDTIAGPRSRDVTVQLLARF